MSDLTRFVEAVFASNGLLSAALPGYEARPGQIAMALRVAESLEHDDILLAEAGTGIGKSLAYLIPSAWWSLVNDETVIVSTYTRALQEQLILKDMPIVEKVTRDVHRKRALHAVTLKGRANYLCRERWQAESGRRSPEPEFANLVGRLRSWVAETTTGDKSELALNDRDERLFARLSASVENCSNTVCRMNQGQKCYFARARSSAQKADIVIVNHALLFSDQGAGGAILPAASRLVIDEAHHLEAVATRQFSFRLSAELLIRHAEALVDLRGTTAGGALPSTVGMLVGAGAFAGSAELSSDAVSRIRATILEADRLARHVRELFDHIAEVARTIETAGETSVRVSVATRHASHWSLVEIAADEVLHDLQALEQQAQWVERALSRAVNEQLLAEPAETAIAAISAWIDENALMAHQIRTSMLDPDANGVYWIERLQAGDSFALCAAPLDVGEWIAGSITAGKETVVMTSATLTVNDSFSLLRQQTGVTDATELVTPSPFDYSTSALIYVANDIPEPVHRDFQEHVDRAIADVSIALQGRTLALFTSHRHLREAAAALREPLAARGIEVLAQGVDAPPQELAERLRDGGRIVVLGAATMWEGIDIPGPGLSALVVVRLPFDVPSDPLFQARSELYRSPFYEYAVPRAVLRFRQGFGRLIRSTEDTGICVLLDRRIVTKSYGRSFLSALPDCKVERGGLSEVGQVAREWIASSGGKRSG